MEEIKKGPQELADALVEEFSVFDEWLDKYEYIIELGKGLAPMDEAEKTEQNLIKGCQSRVWLSCSCSDGRLHFNADSDAIITKGIISMLIRVYDGQEPSAVAASDFAFIKQIGLQENLSPTRANGLLSMIEKIKEYAAAYEKIILALKTVYDPEIPVDIYELGLIYGIKMAGAGDITVTMTLTAPNCPIADEVVEQARAAVSDVPGAGKVEVNLVFEPEWTPERMSEIARIELNM